MERKELIQKVIDRSIHYKDFDERLLEFMEQFPLEETMSGGYHVIKKPVQPPDSPNKPASHTKQWDIPLRRKRYNL